MLIIFEFKDQRLPSLRKLGRSRSLRVNLLNPIDPFLNLSPGHG